MCPEYHVVVDPARLDANQLNFAQVTQALADTNLFTSAGMHEENYQLYLTTVDNRLHSSREIEEVILAWVNQAPVRIRDVAHGAAWCGAAIQSRYGRRERSGAAEHLRSAQTATRCRSPKTCSRTWSNSNAELPPDMRMAFFYDQSQFVREGVRSVWDAIILGLALSVVVLFVFLKSWRATVVAALVIPVTVLLTLIGLKLMGMSFNLMTLGGIAAVVGIVIDDAIVVVEAIYAKVEVGPAARWRPSARRCPKSVPALVGSTHDPGRRVHSAGVSGRRGGRVLPGLGDDDGDRPADFAGAGRHLDAGHRRHC